MKPQNTIRKALITGITGQDGSYLAELLLSKGYEVHGVVRRASTSNTARIDHILSDPHAKECRVFLHYGDLEDSQRLISLVLSIRPDEIYNLAAQSHVHVSFEEPLYTQNTVGAGALRVLEAARQLNETHPVRVYQASSSEMFGDVVQTPQSEITPFHPRSPYACAKVYAYHQTINYREAYGLFACNGILFNHESPRRGETFVTRKITRAVGRILAGLQDKLYLGNLDAKRDWGYAKEYVEAMWMMLQHDEAQDYVVATNQAHTIREFLDVAFASVNLRWNDFVQIDERYCRPTEVDLLLGDASKIKRELGWTPRTTFRDLIKIMVEADCQLASRERLISQQAPNSNATAARQVELT